MQIKGGDKFEAVLKDIANKLGHKAVLQVGFLEGATYPDGTNVAFVAAMNEFGHRVGAAPAAGERDERTVVPPRPFFRNMIADKSGEWPEAIGGLLTATDYDVEKTLELTGEAIQGQLQQSIIDTNSPPLAPSTIARKGSEKPLVESGHMLNSVDFIVKSQGE